MISTEWPPRQSMFGRISQYESAIGRPVPSCRRRSTQGTIERTDVKPTVGDLYDLLYGDRNGQDFTNDSLSAIPVGDLSETVPAVGARQSALAQIEAMTRSLFPGPVSYEHTRDPENPADEWFVFDVIAEGEYKDYREKVFRWHDEVERIVPGTLCEFRLSVMPQR